MPGADRENWSARWPPETASGKASTISSGRSAASLPWRRDADPKTASPSSAAAVRAGSLLPPISWEEYRERFLGEIAGQRGRIEELAARVRAGETITLLCSNSCVNDETCHRSLLRELIENAVGR